ncbi:hypothetical protein NBO_6g0109 [Nosema bombycis CQ1]|uniref:Uncharacterized protein n=1 Tax=Nosema bombycis (strain CQ1 / CVCC 102059) TaxID=578461 RepID=R0MBN8_NOSB1|nr:hypothetical protein NBO_6g0109 [Nosema bombycis CQ1]|eukprot:EOB15359.1 hypothetical protein NBO_6g0109 [Nosema bombycis CQ1]
MCFILLKFFSAIFELIKIHLDIHQLCFDDGIRFHKPNIIFMCGTTITYFCLNFTLYWCRFNWPYIKSSICSVFTS